MRISYAGESAFLLNTSSMQFDASVQARVGNAASALMAHEGVKQAIPGVNNLLMIFDGLAYDSAEAHAWLESAWDQASDKDAPGREIHIAIRYSDPGDEDLQAIAHHADLSVAEIIRLHTSSHYRVASIGAMPGFVYLSGLDPRLCIPRRKAPRMAVEKGAVIIGGGNAGIMPCTAPSGWYELGRTDMSLFDITQTEPCCLRIGDSVRFVNIR